MSETTEGLPAQNAPIVPPLPAGLQIPTQRVPVAELRQPSAEAVTGKSLDIVFGSPTMIGGLLIAIGSFMPWLTITAPLVGTISRSGMDGGSDGIITIVLGSLVFIAGLARIVARLPVLVQLLPVLLGVLTGLVAESDMSNLQTKLAASSMLSPYVNASVGAGLYLVMVGAVVGVIGSITFAAWKKGEPRTGPAAAAAAPKTPLTRSEKVWAAAICAIIVFAVAVLGLAVYALDTV